MLLRKTVRETYALLDKDDTCVVGWGTGSVFKHYFPCLPYNLSYVIDNNPDCWGKKIENIPIYSPEKLLEENPRKTFVVVHSSFLGAIGEQLEQMGFYFYEMASVLCTRKHLETLDAKLQAILRAPRKKETERHGIVVQGPIIPECTHYFIQAYRYLFPSASIVLSTWESTPGELLSQCLPYVDDHVLTATPENRGFQNRNCQICSTRKGIERLQGKNLRYLLKTRTDALTLNAKLFTLTESYEKKYTSIMCRQLGLRGRLFVPETFSRKYLLYHPSDLLVLGHVEDLANYWTIPYDLRDNLAPMEVNDGTLLSLSKAKHPAEAYICQSFFEKIGRELLFTLEDSWQVYRDYFCILENKQFGLFWIKSPQLPVNAALKKCLECISSHFWRRLYSKASIHGL